MLDKLKVLGSVLMIAAHPDDENPAVLTTRAAEERIAPMHLRSLLL